MLAAGTVLADRFRIEKTLGRGGMGAVYLALTPTGDRVAIKEMRLPEVDAQEAVEQFQREALLLASLDHPGLVQVYESFEECGRHYLVMAYVDGQSLAGLLGERQQHFPVDQVVHWGLQLCEVLDYLHSRQPPIIFRDLKPSNIMLDPEGRIRLIDFGIARVFQDDTRTHTFLRGVGSAGYSPVEQYDAGGTDQRSDIYAFGATLYTLLTLQVPPPAGSIAVGLATLQKPRKLNPEIPRPLDRAVSRMMAIRPDDRFSSISEVREALGSPVLSEDVPTLELELPAAFRKEPPEDPGGFPRLEFGRCLAIKFVGPSRPPEDRVRVEVEIARFREEPDYPFLAGVALKAGPDRHSGVTVWLDGERQVFPYEELGFEGACVRVVASRTGVEFEPAQLLGLIRRELVSLAEYLLDNLDRLPQARQVESFPVLHRLAEHFTSASNLEGLERTYKQLVTVHEREPEPLSAGLLRSRLRLGDLYYDQRQLDRSRPLHKLCFEHLERDAFGCLAAGEVAQAIQLKRTAFQLLQKTLDPGHPRLLEFLADLRGLCQDHGHPARELLEEEVRLRQQLAVVDPLALAKCLEDLARVHIAERQLGRAEASLRKAVALLEQAEGPNALELAAPLGLLSEVLLQCGRTPEASELKTRATICRYRGSS